MLPHTPSMPEPFFAARHETHGPVQAALQHTPSTQNPVMQVAGEMQASPFGSLQPPGAHTSAPAHSLSGSVPVAIAPHEPFVPEPFFIAVHAWHSVSHAMLQHTPSTQN